MAGNLLMIGAFATSLALMFVAILAFKYWRRRDARRSPLHGKKLANLPGQQLATRLNDHGDNLLLAGIVMYLSFPAMLFAWAISRVPWETIQFRTIDWILVIGAVGLFGFGMRSFAKHWDARTKARDGLVAERMTGQLLNRLIGPDCVVAHDLPCEGFNIDHIVIAPRAVYAVETKSFHPAQATTPTTKSPSTEKLSASQTGATMPQSSRHAVRPSGWRATSVSHSAAKSRSSQPSLSPVGGSTGRTNPNAQTYASSPPWATERTSLSPARNSLKTQPGR